MKLTVQVLLIGLIASAPVRLAAQFKVAGHDVQVHGFMSQGFAYSDDNNYLTMKTSKGSFAFTDAGLNLSTQITDRFRIGAQAYTRNIGNLGQGNVVLDWAFADYKFADWFGLRGGVVKTTFGLHNDTQDMEFLHTNALLPQSIYPTDLRDALIRHRGGDIYGEVSLKRFGSISYTAFSGLRDDSIHGGYLYMLRPIGIVMNEYGGLQFGGDVRWNSPLPGFLVGFSHMNQDIYGKGTFSLSMAPGAPVSTGPFEEWTNKDQANQVYGQYTRGNLRLEAEYRRWWRDQQIFNGSFSVTTDTRGWYTLAAYRVSKRLELSSYYSRLVPDWRADHKLDTNHLYDKVLTARVDVTRFWTVKLEGHFMDGNSGPGTYPAGFYNSDNPGGMKPKTNLLLIRTGFNF